MDDRDRRGLQSDPATMLRDSDCEKIDEIEQIGWFSPASKNRKVEKSKNTIC